MHPTAEALVAAKPRRLRRDEYERLVALGFFQRERIELLHGTLVQMSPIGPPHRTVVNRLNQLLLPRLMGRAEVFIQQPFAAWDDSEPEPDVTIVPLDDYGARHPDRAFLIIEVSDSSLIYDRESKGPLYAASNVDEYWIVNLVERCVEVHAEPDDGRYQRTARLRAGATIAPRAFPEIVVNVADLLP